MCGIYVVATLNDVGTWGKGVGAKMIAIPEWETNAHFQNCWVLWVFGGRVASMCLLPSQVVLATLVTRRSQSRDRQSETFARFQACFMSSEDFQRISYGSSRMDTKLQITGFVDFGVISGPVYVGFQVQNA